MLTQLVPIHKKAACKCLQAAYTIKKRLCAFFGGDVGRSGEQHVSRGIQRGFGGVLNHADDETDGHHLHGGIGVDVKQAARQWNQQQRATGHA